MLVPEAGRKNRAGIWRLWQKIILLPGLLILGWILAQIFFGLRLSVAVVICAAAVIVSWAALSHFHPVMWSRTFRQIFMRKD